MLNLPDPTYLRRRQYADASNLNARIRLHGLYSTNRYGWQRWVFDHLVLPPAARVLEIGCGPANLWVGNRSRIPDGWDVTLADFSPGMLAAARANLAADAHRFRLVNADAQALPFPDASFDGVIANHMLYHVPDRARALAAIERALRPGGRFYAATNGVNHMWELRPRHLVRRYGLDLPAHDPSFDALTHDLFTLEEGGDELAGYFTNVRLHPYEDSLEVTEAEPLVDYVRSMSSLDEEQAAALRAGLAQDLAEHGVIHITKASGMFEVVKQA